MVVTTGAIRHAKLQSNRHHQHTNTQLFTGRMPLCQPINSVKALKEICGKIMCTCEITVNYKMLAILAGFLHVGVAVWL